MAIYANVEAARAYERSASVPAGGCAASHSAELAEIHEQVADVRYNLNQPELADRAYKARPPTQRRRRGRILLESPISRP